MEFFTSPEDLKGWVQIQDSSDLAATKLMDIIGHKEEQDVVDTCRAIYEQEDMAENASKVLFGVLARHNITQMREGKMKNDKIKKEAQGIYRGEAALYQSMPIRICPKLPAQSNINPAGKRAISTMHCREHCLDSFTFDDNPLKVYCAEALWRRHVMDKFSREWRNDDGKLVGGYINERFQVYHDDGGNKMSLARKERTRAPRPHQYSTERRLEEGRGQDTFDITASSKSHSMVKVASKCAVGDNEDKQVYKMFNDILEMKESGISDEDVLYRVAEHYGTSIFNVAKVQKIASSHVSRNNGVVYASSHGFASKMSKVAQALPLNPTMITKKEVDVVNIANGQPTTLKIETPVVKVTADPSNLLYEITDGPDAGSRFQLSNRNDINEAFGILENIQPAADELGLNEQLPQNNQDIQDDKNVSASDATVTPNVSSTTDFPITGE